MNRVRWLIVITVPLLFMWAGVLSAAANADPPLPDPFGSSTPFPTRVRNTPRPTVVIPTYPAPIGPYNDPAEDRDTSGLQEALSPYELSAEGMQTYNGLSCGVSSSTGKCICSFKTQQLTTFRFDTPNNLRWWLVESGSSQYYKPERKGINTWFVDTGPADGPVPVKASNVWLIFTEKGYQLQSYVLFERGTEGTCNINWER